MEVDEKNIYFLIVWVEVDKKIIRQKSIGWTWTKKFFFGGPFFSTGLTKHSLGSISGHWQLGLLGGIFPAENFSAEHFWWICFRIFFFGNRRIVIFTLSAVMY